ncbi:MAG: hypothetical protein ACXVDA_20020 [Ktedonobacterales bacterium]
MAAKRFIVTLCGLAIVFAGLTIAVKQYALVWWVACLIAVIIAMIIVVGNHNGRVTLPGILLVSGVGVVALLVGMIISSVTAR